MESTRDRCRFLAEFAEQVLGPLHKTDKDPFSGIAADVNAFGWGFASAASRALRHPNLIGANLGRQFIFAINITCFYFALSGRRSPSWCQPSTSRNIVRSPPAA